MLDLCTPFLGSVEGVPNFTDWKAYYKELELYNKCTEDYIEEGYDIKEIVNSKVFVYSEAEIDRMYKTIEIIKRKYPSIQKSLCELFEDASLDVEVVIYHGLGNGAGWADSYGEKKAILLGVEKIVELGWDSEEKLTSLMAHEFAHLAHEKMRGHNLMIYEGREGDIFRMYIEGYATYFEDNFFSRTITMPEWVKSCKELEKELKLAYLEVLKGKRESKHFYGDWFTTFDIPDTGYFLGLQFVKTMLDKYSYIDIGRLTFEEIEDYLISYLES